ncbi:MAG: AraC family transcriptional regulator N-terminal domain-containing protein [Rhizobiaceae bacterium]
MQLDQLIDRASGFFLPDTGDGVPILAGESGLGLIRYRKPTTFECTIYRPIMCLILQGSKETVIGGASTRFGPGQSLIVSHDLPVVSRVTEAEADKPYYALVSEIDLGIVRSLHDKIGVHGSDEGQVTAVNIGESGAALVDVLDRLLKTGENPTEAEVLGPLLKQELHFRLLMAPHGVMLRNLLRRDSHASRIGQAIERIRRDYQVPIKVNELAGEAGMSVSSFHQHFKSVTATTPLQYQKELRLVEARRLIVGGEKSVSGAAFEVGYESPTQFSREYSRKFGTAPSTDLELAAQM